MNQEQHSFVFRHVKGAFVGYFSILAWITDLVEDLFGEGFGGFIADVLEPIVGVLGGFLVCYELFGIIYPVGFLLAFALFIEFVVTRFSGMLSGACVSVLSPALIGLVGVAVLQATFNLFSVNVHQVLAIEISLADAVQWCDATIDLSLLHFSYIILALLFISYCVPRSRAVGRFVLLHKYLSNGVAALALVGSFTFVSSYAFEEVDSFVRSRITNEDRFKTPNDHIALSRLDYTVAKYVATSAQHLSPQQRESYIQFFEGIYDESRPRYRGVVTDLLVEEAIDKAPKPNVPRIAVNDSDLGANEGTSEAWATFEAAFCQALVNNSPKLNGIAGQVFRSIVEQSAEVLFKKGIRIPYGARLEEVVTKIGTWTHDWIQPGDTNQSKDSLLSAEEIVKNRAATLDGKVQGSEFLPEDGDIDMNRRNRETTLSDRDEPREVK